MARPKEWCCLILDASTSMRTPLSRMRAALDCVQQLVLQKAIFAKGDKIALVLMGTHDTANELNTADPEHYCGINVLANFGSGGVTTEQLLALDVLAEPQTKGAGRPSDPVEAIVVAITLFKEKRPADTARIILVSDLAGDVHTDMLPKLPRIGEKMTADRIGLHVFSLRNMQAAGGGVASGGAGGKAGYESGASAAAPRATAPSATEELMGDLATSTPGGSLLSLDNVLHLMTKSRAVAAQSVTMFRGSLDIGGVISIPVYAYKLTMEGKMESLRTGSRSAFASADVARMEAASTTTGVGAMEEEEGEGGDGERGGRRERSGAAAAAPASSSDRAYAGEVISLVSGEEEEEGGGGARDREAGREGRVTSSIARAGAASSTSFSAAAATGGSRAAQRSASGGGDYGGGDDDDAAAAVAPWLPARTCCSSAMSL